MPLPHNSRAPITHLPLSMDGVAEASVLARVNVLDTRYSPQPFTGLVWLASAPAVGDSIEVSALDAGLIAYPANYVRLHEVRTVLAPTTTIIPASNSRQVTVYELHGLWSHTP